MAEQNETSEIDLLYEGNDKLEKIFGEDFVDENQDNIELYINGEKNELTSEYELKKGINNIKLVIKNKLENLSFMFDECKTLKNIDGLKYLNTENCESFESLFNGSFLVTSKAAPLIIFCSKASIMSSSTTTLPLPTLINTASLFIFLKKLISKISSVSELDGRVA